MAGLNTHVGAVRARHARAPLTSTVRPFSEVSRVRLGIAAAAEEFVLVETSR